jgi:hypothetical protein
LSKEIEYFEKKYSFKINFIADATLVIPEYKIELLNKSKKIIDTVKSIDKINEIKTPSKITEKVSKSKTCLKKTKKAKIIKKKVKSLRTLWMRRKKKELN